TPKALELKQPIRDALFAIQQQVQPEAEFDPKTASNTFAIAANEYAESIVFPAFFQYLEQVAPNICFDLHPEADSIASLTERIRLKELDIAIDYIQPKSKELICEHVFEEDLVVMARKGNPYITDEIMTAEIYRSTPHVALH
ncbi:LysR substrate-binding domain-containing protein, partial [Oleiphilus sp. HI0066]